MIVAGTWWIVVRFCRYLWVSHLPPRAGAQTSEVDAGRNVSGDATDVYWWYASHDTLRARLLLLLLEGKNIRWDWVNKIQALIILRYQCNIYIYIITSIQFLVYSSFSHCFWGTPIHRPGTCAAHRVESIGLPWSERWPWLWPLRWCWSRWCSGLAFTLCVTWLLLKGVESFGPSTN